MHEALLNTGLNDLQANCYLFILEKSSTTPPALARHLKLSRTNAYKVLDKLVELQLASRQEVRGKLIYYPEDPVALASLVAEKRNEVLALEQTIDLAIKDLRRKYKHTEGKTSVELRSGKEAVIASYEKQASLKEPVYFVKTRADIPAMGFETMDKIRRLPTEHNTTRYGITPDSPESPTNPEIDKRSNLTRTWIKMNDYTAPVEWSLSGSQLNIVIFGELTKVIQIEDKNVADAFLQLWQLLDKNIRSNPDYRNLPTNAKREV